MYQGINFGTNNKAPDVVIQTMLLWTTSFATDK